jgi:hypothetical protein
VDFSPWSEKRIKGYVASLPVLKNKPIEIVDPENVSVLHPRRAASLTLVTCYPFYFVGDAPQRFIVHANLEARVAATDLESNGTPAMGAAIPIKEGVAK